MYSKTGNLDYWAKSYIQLTPILFIINILEDFTKPLSLSLVLLCDILAYTLIISALP
jgi:F0F1-type ATP synthase membrane subunit a